MLSAGALWNWVCTRDIAYASELSLAWLDTTEQKFSLFKLSEPKGFRSSHCSGHRYRRSWPVSTDRVTWARGDGGPEAYRRSDFRQSVIEAFRIRRHLIENLCLIPAWTLFGETLFGLA